MIKTELTEMLGINHPIIQAGMGPYSTNRLGAAAANAGALGLISTSGFRYGAMQPELVERLTGGETGTTYEMMKRLLLRIKEDTRESQGIFGINCPVAAEVAKSSSEIIQAVIDVRNEDPELKDRLKVIVTSAGDPLPWRDIIKPSGVKWFHVVPSVRHAQRCERAEVDLIIASGHEGGMHIAWEPVHTMVLLPAVVRAVKTPVVGAGGFCDGATLVAALALGAVGVQMGTRFIATKESEFNQFWKDHILKSGERDTIVARGIFGPGRYLKNEVSMELTEMTVSKSPGLYLGQPDDLTTLDPELMRKEMDGFNGLLREDEKKAILPGGEVAGRIGELPIVQELVDGIIREAEEIILNLPKKIGGKK
jgi:NAD(P)H-dependent flavin oxidoreductase YrpB (nitropropane dioxygenase family)